MNKMNWQKNPSYKARKKKVKKQSVAETGE
jgi:hypothetical protein